MCFGGSKEPAPRPAKTEIFMTDEEDNRTDLASWTGPGGPPSESGDEDDGGPFKPPTGDPLGRPFMGDHFDKNRS